MAKQLRLIRKNMQSLRNILSKILGNEILFDVYLEGVEQSRTGSLEIAIRLNLIKSRERHKIAISRKRYYISPAMEAIDFETCEASEYFYKPVFKNSWLSAFKNVNVLFIRSDCPNFSPKSDKTQNTYAKLSWWNRQRLRWVFKQYCIFDKNFLMWIINIMVALLAIIVTIKTVNNPN